MSIQTKTNSVTPQLQPPSLYQVVFFDDDISTCTFVIEILINFFNKNDSEAYSIDMEADITGTSIAGVYPKGIAETKLALANQEIRSYGYPLHIELKCCG